MRYIYLVRHGNPGQPDEPSRCLGATDVSLSEYGKEQICKSKEYIHSFPWTKVYVSPMRRCLESAQCLGIDSDRLTIKENLHEMPAGIWENLTFDQIKKEYPKLYEARGKAIGTFAVEGAESFKEAGERFAQCIDEICGETQENLLVISHAGVIRGFLCKLTGRDYDQVMDYTVPYGSVTVLKETGDGLEVVEYGLRSLKLLDMDEVKQIYEKCGTPKPVVSHMKKVAEVTLQIMDEKMDQFTEYEKEIVYKAALLHDIKRTEKNHDKKSADYLRKEGYKDIAELVALHHSTLINVKPEIELHEILFYADKLVMEDRVVFIEDRFAKSFERCKGIEEAEAKHQALYEKAIWIKEKIGG
ncbi:MAG: HD domain-containing protein [Lachnospiraceae bacterium]|nr:HD domain-containing protein [Lachnospiraceae bacterium]